MYITEISSISNINIFHISYFIFDKTYQLIYTVSNLLILTMNNTHNDKQNLLSIEEKQHIAQSILDNAISQGANTLFFTMQASLRVNFLKHGINTFIDLEEEYQVHTYQDSLDVCIAFCNLFTNSMKDIASNHGGTLDYKFNNQDYRLRYVCHTSYPNGFSITVLIN